MNGLAEFRLHGRLLLRKQVDERTVQFMGAAVMSGYDPIGDLEEVMVSAMMEGVVFSRWWGHKRTPGHYLHELAYNGGLKEKAWNYNEVLS